MQQFLYYRIMVGFPPQNFHGPELILPFPMQVFISFFHSARHPELSGWTLWEAQGVPGEQSAPEGSGRSYKCTMRGHWRIKQVLGVQVGWWKGNVGWTSMTEGLRGHC